MNKKIVLNRIKLMLPPNGLLATMTSVSFIASFTLIVYSPIDIYLNNPSNFIVSLKFILPSLFIFFIASFSLIMVILWMLWRRNISAGIIVLTLCIVFVFIARFLLSMFSAVYIHIIIGITVLMIIWVLLLKILKETAVDAVILLIFGFVTAGYTQTLFLNGRMVEIAGTETGYYSFSVFNIINFLVWVIISIIPLLLFVFFKLKKKQFRYKKVLVFTTLIITVMQTTGLVSTALSTDLPAGIDDELPVYFTYEAATNLNRDENIIVFVLDSLDGLHVTEVFAKYPHLRDNLDGFTFYENNVAEHFGTVLSMVSMITHHHVSSETMTPWDYREEAWALPNFIDTLRENGFSTNLFLDRPTTFERNELKSNRTDNIREADGIKVNLRHLIPITTRLSLGRSAPYLLKDTFLATVHTAFGGALFTTIIEKDIENFVPVVWVDSDVRFYYFLVQSEFSAENEQNVFIMMHLNSIHASIHEGADASKPPIHGYILDDETGIIRHGADNILDVLRASFEILNVYFSKLKEAGVYNNSTIIITGDHGRRGIPHTTALLIKPKNSAGALVSDTTTELSHKYFAAGILDIAGIEHKEFGISYYDIINGIVPTPPERRQFVIGDWSPLSVKTEGDHGFWEIRGDANNRESWTFVPTD